jgi:hypothetical protein
MFLLSKHLLGLTFPFVPGIRRASSMCCTPELFSLQGTFGFSGMRRKDEALALELRPSIRQKEQIPGFLVALTS